MSGVKGKTGNPGVRNPKKRGGGSFKILGVEPKGRQMGFRPVESLEQQIDEALAASGLKQSELLELAVIAYLEKSPEEMQRELKQLLEQRQVGLDPSKPLPKNVRRDAIATQKESPTAAGQQLEQGQPSSNTSAPEEPAAAPGDETPASGRLNAEGQEQQALDTQTSSKSKTRPGTRTKTRKAARG